MKLALWQYFSLFRGSYFVTVSCFVVFISSLLSCFVLLMHFGFMFGKPNFSAVFGETIILVFFRVRESAIRSRRFLTFHSKTLLRTTPLLQCLSYSSPLCSAFLFLLMFVAVLSSVFKTVNILLDCNFQSLLLLL